MGNTVDENLRPCFDLELQAIAEYVCSTPITSQEAYQTAQYCLQDSLGCAILALRYQEARKLLGPLVPGTVVSQGARVPGTQYELDPVQAAFNITCLIRWLDFNDTWLAAEWGHPSDNLGAILAVMDFQNRRGKAQYTLQDVLTAMIKAHEIQGILALENSFNRVGLDHVLLVKLASTAVATHLLGGSRDDIINALSQVFVDGQALRTYRHAPNTGSRKSWAAGDATSRAVRLSLLTLLGERGYPSAITAKTWGFADVLFKGQPLVRHREYGSYVMENVLFKIAFPAEFHAQTAVEAAINLHRQLNGRFNEIAEIECFTQESAVRIISKTGPLYNPADRDHCLQYMIAIGLIYGELTADHYEDATAQNPLIDALRAKMRVQENLEFTKDYLEPSKRAIANEIRITLSSGETLVERVDYPIGHRRRREEGIPVLVEKFKTNLSTLYPAEKVQQLSELCGNFEALSAMQVDQFMGLWVF
jgi:2-methylcitrate dehydratase